MQLQVLEHRPSCPKAGETFPDQGLNPCLLSWQADSLPLSHQGSPIAAKSLQLCPTLCDPRDGSPPGSSIHGIFQARVLEWGAIAFSEGSPRWALFRAYACQALLHWFRGSQPLQTNTTFIIFFFVCGETKAQRGYITHSRSTNQWVAEAGFKPWPCSLEKKGQSFSCVWLSEVPS